MDPLLMQHPQHSGSSAAHSALDDAANCGRKILSILDEAKSADLSKDEEQALIEQGVANGIGILIHLTRAVAYSVAYVGDGLPYAGKGT